MLFRVLPRVGLGVLIADAEGIGYALPYEVIEPKPEALDAVADTDGYGALAQKGFDAEQADTWALSAPSASEIICAVEVAQILFTSKKEKG